MGKNKTIRAQFNYAINSSFDRGHGTSKHSDKKNGGTDNKIYSYNTRNNRLKVANQFSDYLKEKHPEVKQVTEIEQEHIKGFLFSKVDSCNSETLNQYRAQLGALAGNVNHTYKSDCDWSCKKMEGRENSLIRTNAMTREDFDKIRDTYTPFSSGYNALTVAGASGCRVSELAHLKNKDITIDRDKAYVQVIDGKGGRDRLIEITDTDRVRELEEVKMNLGGAEARVYPGQHESLSKNLNRHMKEAGVKGNYENQGFHSVRKMVAQEMYDDYRQDHSMSESLSYVSQELGHGEDRDLETLQRYIKNIH